MDKDLKIPYDQRHKFAEPLDVLIAGTREKTIRKVEEIFREKEGNGLDFNFFLVGDIVTKDFLSNSFLKKATKLCIIDEKTKREQIKIELKGHFEEIVEFINPAGMISKKSWSLLTNIIANGKNTLLKITEGEEDLLVLPLVLALPIEEDYKNYVFYGQPPITDAKKAIPQGIVIVEISEKTQQKVKELINLMEEI